MTRFAAALIVPLLVTAAPALGAERNYTVTGYDRIRVDGAYRVRVTTGVPPFARASAAEAAALDGVSIEVIGRTLVVRPAKSSSSYTGRPSGPVEIAVGTHELGVAWLNGSGSVEINQVKGLSFDLSIQGAGSARIGTANVDQLKLAIAGMGSARLGGTVGKATATVRGMSQFDGSELAVKDAVIGTEGPSIVRMNVSGTAKVDAHGTAQVDLTGDPACTVKTLGSAAVSGCR